MTRRATRQAAYRLGHRGETLAAWWLRVKGFRILETRYRSPYGEIDLIARRGKLVVFAEIKARPTHDEGALSITAVQRERIGRAAAHYLGRRGWQDCNCRFDAITVAPRQLPRHLADAWSL